MLKRVLVVLVIIFALVDSYLLSVSPYTKSLFSRYHLLPEPEKLTELYFENHLDLPKKVVLNKSLPFSFTIHNLEYQSMLYHWEVQTVDADSTKVVASGEANLANDKFQTIQSQVKLASASGRIQVVVKLLNPDQTIHFWLEK